MNKPLISVIVPVYNAGGHLKRCVASILEQTYDNLEVILINDGSTDESVDMCEALASEDARVTVTHQPNGGVSAARNLGIDISNGSLVSFVDADDYVETDFLDHLYANLVKHRADIVACGVIRHKTNESPELPIGEGSVRVSNREDGVIGCIRDIAGYASVWNRLYTRQVIGDLRFSRDFVYAEDQLFNFLVYSNAALSVIDDTPKYHYIQWGGSTSATRERISNDRLRAIQEMRLSLPSGVNRSVILDHIDAREVIDHVQILINIVRSSEPGSHATIWDGHSQALSRMTRRLSLGTLPPKFKIALSLAAVHPGLL